MKTTDFDYFLPEELIADYPLDCRSSSRLLVNINNVEHKCFKDIIEKSSKEQISFKATLAVSPKYILKGNRKNNNSKIRVVFDACFR